MSRGFLPFQDSFGNYFSDNNESDFRSADADTYAAQQALEAAMDNQADVEEEKEDDPTDALPIGVYPTKIQGFFVTTSGTKLGGSGIFYQYNQFSAASNASPEKCQINNGNITVIANDISTIQEDPFDMISHLLSVQEDMFGFQQKCGDLVSEDTTETGELTPDGEPLDGMPIGGGGIGGGGIGGGGMSGNDMSIYCSQVPDDPACQQGGLQGILGGKRNWLLIAGIGVAGFLAYRYFFKGRKKG